MISKNSLYVSAIRYFNQLKVDYKQFSNGNIIKSEQASFVTKNNTMSQDAVFKLNILEQREAQTYISTLCDSIEQRVLAKNRQPKSSEIIVSLNHNFNVAIEKSLLFETKYFFNSSGIDFIYSPFHILSLHCEQNQSGNSLCAFILNNFFYFVILDGNSQIIHSSIEILTSFDDIQNTNFYEDDVTKQKLFDEIYYLELKSIISSTLQKFYTTKQKIFINKVTILQVVRQLNDEQIQKLAEELLLDLNYHSICLDDFIYELAKQPKKLQQSFISPRKKRKSRFLFLSLLSISLLATLGGFYFYNFMMEQKEITQKEIIKQAELRKIENEKPKLPNHKQQNTQMIDEIKSIFASISDSTVLDALKLEQNSLTLDISLLKSDIYIKELQPELLKLFRTSSIQFKESKNKEPLKATIINTQPILDSNKKIDLLAYKNDRFLTKFQIENILKSAFNEDTVFLFRSAMQEGRVSIFGYEVTTTTKNPSELFNAIEKINNSPYSITISFPITMKKLDKKGMQTTFTLQFNQAE